MRINDLIFLLVAIAVFVLTLPLLGVCEDGDNALLPITAPDIADGTVTDVEFQYINSLSSNAQTQITAKGAHAGQAWTGAHDFGGATTVEIPNGDSPDASTQGEIAVDTDGWLRVSDDVDEKGIPLDKTIQFTVINPNDMEDGVRDACIVWSNETGMTFIIDEYKGWSDTDDTTLNLEEEDADGANNGSIDETSLELATDGTGVYTGADDGTINAPNIETGHIILVDFDDTDDPGMVKITIKGHFDGDVD